MSDKIREFQDKMRNIHGSDQLLAAVSYLPLFGWIYPYLVKKDDSFCQFHGKQAFYLNITMLAVYFTVWVLENFPIVSWIFGNESLFHPISRAVWLLTAIAYLGLSTVGFFKAFMKEEWEVPLLVPALDKILEQIKKK